MTCIHGLDDINCPICRINISTVPKKSIKIKNLNENELKPYFHESKLSREIINDIVPNLSHNKKIIKNSSINPIPEIKILNELPDFKNKMFQERMNELNMDKSGNLKLLKKVSLENPEWKFEE